jgi:PBP1b-binding outer membrane lipoprotein LpoB
MKKLLILIPVVTLAACSTVGNPTPATNTSTKIQPNMEVQEMSRTDVISASRECINARMKPVIQSVPQKTDHGTILIPVGVNCEVYGPTYPQQ